MVDKILHILIGIIWGLSLLCSLAGLYQVVIALFSLRKRRSQCPVVPGKRFTILIAARNEGQVIGSLVDSLMQLNYPRDLYRVAVIPNNCTDDTETVARQHGAHIVTCAVPVKTKGQVLSFVFDHLTDNLRADAFCIFDADNIVHPDFLLHMNQALCNGAHVAQGYRDSKNPHDTAISSCMSIYYWLSNRFYYQARSTFNLSAMINGTGFMVSDTFLKRLQGWHTFTMTEDIEFSILSNLAGEKVAWVPEAITYDEQPMTLSQSIIQRKRWSIGILQGLPLYLRPMIKNWIQSPSWARMDIVMFNFTAIAQYLSIFLIPFGFVLRLLVLPYPLFPLTSISDQFVLSIILSIAAPTAVALLTVLLERKWHVGMLKGILFFWVFLATYIPINIISLFTFQNNFDWTPIVHSRAIQLKDLPDTAKK